jgi:hypothetical protein
MTAADEMGFDNQFEEQLRAVVKEASLDAAAWLDEANCQSRKHRWSVVGAGSPVTMSVAVRLRQLLFLLKKAA